MADVDDIRYQHHLKHRGRTNKQIFWITWSTIAVITSIRVTRKVFKWWVRRCRRRHRYPKPVASSLIGILRRGLAFMRAISIVPLPAKGRLAMPTWTLGCLLFKVFYMTIAVSILTGVDASILTPHFLDDVAFRAAWLTLTQIPLVYFLSSKRGLLNIIAGFSYERINHIHRWAGRIMFLSATIHMAIMNSSISMRDILHSHDKSMSVVRYGFGAYSLLAWIAVTSVLPLRAWSYRAFYINHWISTLAFLVIIFVHVPSHARTPTCLATVFVALDKLLVSLLFFRNNFSIRSLKHKFAKFRRGPGRDLLVAGYPVEMTAPSLVTLGLPRQTKDSTTIIRICNLPFTWKPGQHVRLYIPALGALEMHPFTPANCSVMPPPPLPPRMNRGRENFGLINTALQAQISEMMLMIRAHSGFTRRLGEYYAEWLTRPCPNASELPSTLTAYIDGPYGSPPAWELYENLVLIGTSSGVSFILAIVDHLEQLCFTGNGELKTKTVTFMWITRHVDPQLEEMVQGLLLRYSTILRESNITVEADFYTTCLDSDIGPRMIQHDPFSHLRRQRGVNLICRPALKIRNPSEIYEEWSREAQMETLNSEEVELFMSGECDSARNSFESDGISEISTLVEGRMENESDADPFSDAYATGARDAAYRPLLTPLPPSLQGTARVPHQSLEVQSCHCAVIQHQRQKLGSFRRYDTITRNFSTRPNISQKLSDVISQTSTGATMVAVCSNENIVRAAQSTVARMNLDCALGRRKGRVEIFVEGLG
ncbi:Nn.00g096920.m01.CDS01 [Neocucurbitaria sp. VM-36]